MTANLIWGGLLLAGLVYEILALRSTRRGDTLSERVRAWFRVHTRPGRALFAVAWTGFAAWFLVHILA
ncbi:MULTISPECIES: hypothetical protein [unclassified Streptomyces]|uniref:hypothetical protein n=1 Tax=unclassified Streptomyces TaxID=2593676 RepID=UPI0022B72F64|nr:MULTISPECIES: hypothetical protein [unclassified Streptomyces]MCZ7415122.1 hypothetical protein [Streptomyces sp. WMMC897]MCZ7432065.1 hypothetical protein [Streptomyces sp. WMMC1477]